MNLLKFLLKRCRSMVLVTGLIALFGGACNAGLIALVNLAVNDPDGTTAALLLAFAALDLAILLGGSVYLACLSWRVLLAMCLFIAFGACCYRLLITSGFRSLQLARQAEDRLFGHFRGLTEGIKELKLHRERRGAFLNDGMQSATADF